MGSKIHKLLTITGLSISPLPLFASKIADISDVSLPAQAARFFNFADTSVQIVLSGCILLGICCGLLGSFMVVRKRSLLGDTLSHAVLPGVALGFLWSLSKNPLPLLIGATLAGILGTFTVDKIKSTTKLPLDASMGLVLSGFYGVGIVLLTMIQNLPIASQSGLDKFLFGQAAALSSADVSLMAIITLFAITFITLFYKELLLTSFDSSFAHATVIPKRFINTLFMLLLAFTIVISLKAVGVVLVSAMLIIPPTTALLLASNLRNVLALAAFFGALAGISGAFLSFLAHNLPTGPFMVISAATVFSAAFLFAPKHGLIPRWYRNRDNSIH